MKTRLRDEDHVGSGWQVSLLDQREAMGSDRTEAEPEQNLLHLGRGVPCPHYGPGADLWEVPFSGVPRGCWARLSIPHPHTPSPKASETGPPEVWDPTGSGNLGFLDPGCSPSTVCANIPKPEALCNRRPFCSRGLGAARPAPLHRSEQGRGSGARSFPQCCCGFHLGYEVPGELRGVCARRVSAAGRGKGPRKRSAGPLPRTPKDTKDLAFPTSASSAFSLWSHLHQHQMVL